MLLKPTPPLLAHFALLCALHPSSVINAYAGVGIILPCLLIAVLVACFDQLTMRKSASANGAPKASLRVSHTWIALAPARHTPLASPAVKHLPNELMYIVARFMALDVAHLVRADRALWTRFGYDPLLWADAFASAQTCKAGRATLRSHASSILVKWPALRRSVPLLLSCAVQHFTVSPDGTRVACASERDVQVFDAESSVRIRAIKAESLIRGLCYSASGARLACIGQTRYPFVSCQHMKAANYNTLKHLAIRYHDVDAYALHEAWWMPLDGARMRSPG